MNRKAILLHKQQLLVYFSAFRKLTLLLLVLVGAAYCFALILLMNGKAMIAVGLATAVFLFAHQLKSVLPSMTRFYLRRKGGYEELLDFLDKEQKHRTEVEFMGLLQKALDSV